MGRTRNRFYSRTTGSLSIKEISIAFYRWMKLNDTVENAEKWFHYTDEDMYEAFLQDWKTDKFTI